MLASQTFSRRSGSATNATGSALRRPCGPRMVRFASILPTSQWRRRWSACWSTSGRPAAPRGRTPRTRGGAAVRDTRQVGTHERIGSEFCRDAGREPGRAADAAGSLLTGLIVEIGPDVVMVSAGLKSDSAIPAGQFRDESGQLTVAVGDEVEVALDAVEDGFGETRLSREKAKRAQAWRRLEGAFENSDNVSGVISGKVKGGFTVDIDDIRAFLPAPWSTCGRCATPPTSKASRSNSRSSSSTRGATTSWCRVGRWWRSRIPRSARRCSNASRKARS